MFASARDVEAGVTDVEKLMVPVSGAGNGEELCCAACKPTACDAYGGVRAQLGDGDEKKVLLPP